MLDLRFVAQNTESVRANCRQRGFDIDVDEIIRLEERRRQTLQELEAVRHESKQLAKQ